MTNDVFPPVCFACACACAAESAAADEADCRGRGVIDILGWLPDLAFRPLCGDAFC